MFILISEAKTSRLMLLYQRSEDNSIENCTTNIKISYSVPGFVSNDKKNPCNSKENILIQILSKKVVHELSHNVCYPTLYILVTSTLILNAITSLGK